MDLKFSTGSDQVDAIMRGVVSIYERMLPERIRSYYLTGSYTNGTAVPLSDIDLYLVFAEYPFAPEREVVEEIRNACCHISPLAIDIGVLGYDRLQRDGHVAIQQGRLLYGDEILQQVGYPSVDLNTKRCMDGAYHMIARNRSQQPLPYPVPAPDPASPLLGYERRSLRAGTLRLKQSTKELVVVVGAIATALIAYRAGAYVEKKSLVPQKYRACVGDGWTNLVDEIFSLCHQRYQYHVPPAGPDLDRLQELCHQVLALENHFMAIYRDHERSRSTV